MEAARDWVVGMFKEHVDVFTSDMTVTVATAINIVLLLVLVPFGAKFMVKGLTFVMVLEGIFFLLFPEIGFRLFAAENVDPDVLHLQEIRSIGINDLAIGMTFFLTMKSSDNTVHSSYLLSMTLCMGCSLLVQGASLAKGNSKFNSNMQNLGCTCRFGLVRTACIPLHQTKGMGRLC
ncbi:uncharacterized protein LOC117322103 [Pecten maximus]|uniref:uncharacterized protein LOC117322103 n=1 Tax=Pecten maximus TaxID=6579 RepID=UPI0014589F07|nr:uncharacterized protein LOC117322103 [Pecten maximus]